MNHDLKYPVKKCHFCHSVMIYQRYDNGRTYAHCNNHYHTACMAFDYVVVDDCIRVGQFNIGLDDVLYFATGSAFREDGSQLSYGNRTIFSDAFGGRKIMDNLIETDTSVILDRDNTIRLLDNIRRAAMLRG
jgi:hypothetical protein